MFVNLVGFWCCSSVGCRFLISFLGFGGYDACDFGLHGYVCVFVLLFEVALVTLAG